MIVDYGNDDILVVAEEFLCFLHQVDHAHASLIEISMELDASATALDPAESRSHVQRPWAWQHIRPILPRNAHLELTNSDAPESQFHQFHHGPRPLIKQPLVMLQGFASKNEHLLW
jgi:hypothetical protein